MGLMLWNGLVDVEGRGFYTATQPISEITRIQEIAEHLKTEITEI